MYVLYRISTDQVLRYNVADEQAESVVGLDPDLLYLHVVEQAIPDYDPRQFVLVTQQARQGGDWAVTYSTALRPTAEVIAAIDNAERLHAADHVRSEEMLTLTILGMAVLFRKISGLQLTAKEQVVADRVTQAGVRLWKNRDNAVALKAVAQAGGTPDFDAGWEPAV